MPLPGGLARVNRVLTNRITKPFARRLPGFCVLEHKGRASGALYQTPLNAWSDGESIVVPLTYGSEVDWLKNAREAPASTIILGGEPVAVGAPEVIGRAVGYERIPKKVGVALAALNVDEFAVFPILP